MLRWNLPLGKTIAVIVWVVVACQPLFAQSQCRVLLYSSGDCGIAGLSERTEAGQRLLAEQFKRCGIPAENIRQVTAVPLDGLRPVLRELAASATANDSLLCILLGAGVHRESAAEAQDALLAPDGTNDETAIAVQDVLNLLGTSNCRNQMLIVDGGVGADAVQKLPESQKFGTGVLSLLPGQTVILSRSVRQRDAASLFTAVVADAMTELADQTPRTADAQLDSVLQSGDKSISGTEFTQYLLSYSANYQMAPQPRISSSLTEDLPLVPAAPLDDTHRLSRDVRQQMVNLLVQSAYQALLLNKDPHEARLALQRALAFRPEKTQREEIIALWLTSVCANGSLIDAWSVASSRGQPLLVIAPKGLNLQSGSRIVAKLEGNEVLQFTEKTQGGVIFFKAQQVLRAELSPGVISFTQDPALKNLYVRLDQIEALAGQKPSDTRRDEALRLVNILRGIEQQEDKQDPAAP